MNSQIEYHHLLWQCRRGMLELDLLLLSFVEKCYYQLTEDEVSLLKCLLAENDPTLAQWFLGNSCPQDPELAELVELIKREWTKT